MYLLAALRLLRRRWPVALAGVLFTAAGCFALSSLVKPQYEATSQIMFILPPAATPESPTNPYLNLPDGMQTTANLIAAMVSTGDVADDLAETGADAPYTVMLVPNAGPLLQITVTGTDPETTLLTRDALMDLIDEDLARVQAEADVPENQIMTATRPTVSRDAQEMLSGVYMRLAGAAVAGLLGMLLTCFAVDRLLARRARRKALAAAGAEPEVLAEPEEADAEVVDPEPAPEPAPEPVAEPAPEPVAEPDLAAFATPIPAAFATPVLTPARVHLTPEVVDEIADEPTPEVVDEVVDGVEPEPEAAEPETAEPEAGEPTPVTPSTVARRVRTRRPRAAMPEVEAAPAAEQDADAQLEFPTEEPTEEPTQEPTEEAATATPAPAEPAPAEPSKTTAKTAKKPVPMPPPHAEGEEVAAALERTTTRRRVRSGRPRPVAAPVDTPAQVDSEVDPKVDSEDESSKSWSSLAG